jgi:DNA-binding GntR family transcriptional regulator
MPGARVVRRSGAEAVYAELRRRIITLELAPGSRLKETELAEALQVSRTPLREAIKLLLAEDLLEQLPAVGVAVPRLSGRDIDELYTCRAALEAIQAGEAARHATSSDIEALRAIVERNTLLVRLADDAMHAGHNLHELIADIAGHRWANRLHEHVDGHMARYRRLTNSTQERRNQALQEHIALVDAIAARDPDRSARVARDHVLAAQDEARTALEHREPDAS